MDNLYIKVYKIDGTKIFLPLESLVVLFIYEHCKPDSLRVNLVINKTSEDDPVLEINLQHDYNLIDQLPKLATYCVLPIIIVQNTTVISGLCSVARQIIKSTSPGSSFRNLLGFREACLMACNEASIWTKFCEVDIITTAKTILLHPENFIKSTEILIPKDLTRYEIHMSQPVRIHNMYKVAQDQAKGKVKKASEINPTIPKEQLELTHLYAEGPFMTLADIILYSSIYVIKMLYSKHIFDKHLPLVTKWFTNMSNEVQMFEVTKPVPLFSLSVNDDLIVVQENLEKSSLYVSDPRRYKPKNRIYTKQSDISNALNIIKDLNLNLENSKPYGFEFKFDWSNVPLEANPKGGALPASRMKRKCEQLENLAKPVVKLAKSGHVIVDFCSGSGHLGILLACQLPNCTIILLENKETSLLRAKLRVSQLKLDNVIFLQCNLDYFKAEFDIGVSLHACGVATDLVIQHCLKRRAIFVSCPCCYGGVHNCHHITYPRSNIFKNSQLTSRDYLVIGHSADQTHDSENAKTKQGFECMNIIDTDRKLQAEEEGYVVHLGKMIPESCTPKNNILVGWPK